MDWDTAVKLKWGTLILIAGGFALSEGVSGGRGARAGGRSGLTRPRQVQASGLSQEIGG